MEESDFSANAYDKVYDAPRPEIFFKSLPEKVVGPGEDVGIRRDAIDDNPELPIAVYEMYSAAKRLAYADLETTTSLKVSLPWVTQEFEETRALISDDYWRYGIEKNQKELELVMRYTHEQGLVREHEDFRKLFHPSTLET